MGLYARENLIRSINENLDYLKSKGMELKEYTVNSTDYSIDERDGVIIRYKLNVYKMRDRLE